MVQTLAQCTPCSTCDGRVLAIGDASSELIFCAGDDKTLESLRETLLKGQIFLHLRILPDPTRINAWERKVNKLIDILTDLDEFDTPKVKLPNCPKCDEDELGVIHADLILCYACGWKLEGKR